MTTCTLEYVQTIIALIPRVLWQHSLALAYYSSHVDATHVWRVLSFSREKGDWGKAISQQLAIVVVLSSHTDRSSRRGIFFMEKTLWAICLSYLVLVGDDIKKTFSAMCRWHAKLISVSLSLSSVFGFISCKNRPRRTNRDSFHPIFTRLGFLYCVSMPPPSPLGLRSCCFSLVSLWFCLDGLYSFVNRLQADAAGWGSRKTPTITAQCKRARLIERIKIYEEKHFSFQAQAINGDALCFAFFVLILLVLILRGLPLLYSADLELAGRGGHLHE